MACRCLVRWRQPALLLSLPSPPHLMPIMPTAYFSLVHLFLCLAAREATDVQRLVFKVLSRVVLVLAYAVQAGNRMAASKIGYVETLERTFVVWTFRLVYCCRHQSIVSPCPVLPYPLIHSLSHIHKTQYIPLTKTHLAHVSPSPHTHSLTLSCKIKLNQNQALGRDWGDRPLELPLPQRLQPHRVGDFRGKCRRVQGLGVHVLVQQVDAVYKVVVRV